MFNQAEIIHRGDDESSLNSNQIGEDASQGGNDLRSITTDGGGASIRARMLPPQYLRKQFYHNSANFNGVSMEDIRKESSDDGGPSTFHITSQNSNSPGAANSSVHDQQQPLSRQPNVKDKYDSRGARKSNFAQLPPKGNRFSRSVVSGVASRASGRADANGRSGHSKGRGEPPTYQEDDAVDASIGRQLRTATSFDFHEFLSSTQKQNQINYKLMVKPMANQYRPQDFKLIEDAILNLEANIPQQQQTLKARRAKSTAGAGRDRKDQREDPLLTQKRLVESLERSITASKVHRDLDLEHQNYIYRLALKIHAKHRLQPVHKDHQGNSIEIQVSQLISLLNAEAQKIEDNEVALQTHWRCLMQKGFLSLLDNMTELLKSGSRCSTWRRDGEASERRQESPLGLHGDDDLDSRSGAVRARQETSGDEQNSEEQNEISFRISRNSAHDMQGPKERATIVEGTGTQQLKSILKSPKDRGLTSGAGRSPKGLSQSPAESSGIESPDSSSMQSPGRQGSPAERKLMRKIEKENSPVRAFLNAKEPDLEGETFAIRELETDEAAPSRILDDVEPYQPQIIEVSQISSIFDKDRYKNRTAMQDSQANRKAGQAIVSQANQNSLLNQISKKSQQRSVDSSKSSRSQENFKILLKCVRIWKIFTKQEILRREQAKIVAAQKHRHQELEVLRQRQLDSEIELSKEMSVIRNEWAIAMNHHENHLMAIGLQGLIENIFACKHELKQKQKLLWASKSTRLRRSCFKKWYLVVQKVKQMNREYQMYENYHHGRICRLFIQTLRSMILKKKQKLKKLIARRAWNMKKRVFQQGFVQSLLYQGRRNQQKCSEFQKNSRVLLKLCFEVIKNMSGLSRKKIIQFRKNQRFYRAQRVYQAWADVTEKNCKLRSQFYMVRSLHKSYSKQIVLKSWIRLLTELRLCGRIRRKSLTKKVIRSLLKFIERRERKQMVLRACENHIQTVRGKQIIKAWQRFVPDQRKEREVQRHMHDRMQRFKQRQVFKSWFNQIDILKRWRFLNENTEAWYSRKMRRRVFRSWKNQVRLKNLYFQAYDRHVELVKKRYVSHMAGCVNTLRAYRYVSRRHEQATGENVLRQWYGLLDNRHLSKFQFRKKRKNRVLRGPFDALAQYRDKKVKFREGMKRLLKMRAKNLMRHAYARGLKQIWHQKVIETNMVKASEYFYRSRLLKRPFARLARRVKAKKNGRAAGPMHCAFLRKTYMKKWLTRYMKNDIAQRYQKRRQTTIMFNVFHYFANTCRENKSLQYRLERFESIHKFYLKQNSFQYWENYKNSRIEKKKRYREIEETKHSPYLLKKSYRYWKNYIAARKLKTADKIKYARIGRYCIMRRTLSAMRGVVEQGCRARFLSLRRTNRIKFNCLAALREYGTDSLKARIFLEKVNLRLKSLVFNGLFRYMSYRSYFKQKEGDLTDLNIYNTQRNFFNKLACWRLQSQFDKQCTRVIHQKRCATALLAWQGALHEAIDEGQERHLATALFAKHMLHRFRRACQLDKDTRRFKANLHRKQQQFYNFNSKRRAIQKIMKNVDDSHLHRIKREYVTKVRAKRIFCAWREAIDVFKRKRILLESAQLMHNNAVIERSLRALREYADRRIKDKLVVVKFQERSELGTMADVLVALSENVQFRKIQREKFYRKLVFVAEKTMMLPFLRWKGWVEDEQREEKAAQFYRQRSAQYILRLSWDSLRVHTIRSVQKSAQRKAVDEWHGKLLLQKAVLSLKMATHDSRRLTSVSKIIGLSSNQTLQRKIFEAFKEGLVMSRVNRELKQRADLFCRHNTYRKCLIGLQLPQYQRQQVATIQSRVNARMAREKMLLWYDKMLWCRKLSKLVSILRDQNDCRLAHRFFPTLVKNTFQLQIQDHVTQRRVQTYQQEFINEVRKRILMKKILKSFRMRNELDLKRAILVELRINARDKQRHKDAVASRIEYVEGEANSDILQIAFNCLKERVVLKKFKRISQNCYRLKCLRKYFCALQEYDLRRKILRNKGQEIRRIQEAKYLWHWRQAYIKEREKEDASNFLQSATLHQIMRWWRAYAGKRAAAKHFYKNVALRNKVSYAFQAWQFSIAKDIKLREAARQASIINKSSTERKFLYLWLQQTHSNKIEAQMAKFHNMKMLKAVVSAWREIKNRNNDKRLRVHRIREQLRQKPDLGRPLKALRNFLAFRAFNKLLEGARLVHQEDQQTDTAHCAYYLRITKKTFLSLKLNAQLKYQDKRADEISDLFLKRRWLGYMRAGIEHLKDRRKMRHKASIFRFLALQKKALQGLIHYSVSRQELRIKKEFAMKLYYKRLLDLGFGGLKIYKSAKQQKRLERRNDKESAERSRSQSRSPDGHGLFTPTIMTNLRPQNQTFARELLHGYNSQDRANQNSDLIAYHDMRDDRYLAGPSEFSLAMPGQATNLFKQQIYAESRGHDSQQILGGFHPLSREDQTDADSGFSLTPKQQRNDSAGASGARRADQFAFPPQRSSQRSVDQLDRRHPENPHLTRRDGGGGSNEMADNANEIVTLGGTLFTQGTNEKTLNAFTLNGEMKGRESSMQDAEERSSAEGREWQQRHAKADSVPNNSNAPVGMLGQQLHRASRGEQRDQVFSFKDLNQHADRDEADRNTHLR